MWPTEFDDFESIVQPPEDDRADDAWYFVFIGSEILCLSERGIPRPVERGDLRWVELEREAELYLGRYRGRNVYALAASGRPPEGYALVGLRNWLGRVEPSVFYLAGRAQQLLEWHRDHQYCGRCGGEMTDHAADRAKECESCGLINYPRLSPSIIVLVHRGEEMLLARNARWPTNMFSTLAGFVEPGESIEQTVHREVLEEVGLRVKNLRYLGSQSWPFPNSLMLGFHAEYASGEIRCQEGEIAEARWFRPDALPNVPPGTAISSWLIQDFVKSVAKTGA